MKVTLAAVLSVLFGLSALAAQAAPLPQPGVPSIDLAVPLPADEDKDKDKDKKDG